MLKPPKRGLFYANLVRLHFMSASFKGSFVRETTRMDAANQKHKHCAELERLSLEFAGRLLDLYLPTLETSLLEMADAERGEQQMLLLSLVRELKAFTSI